MVTNTAGESAGMLIKRARLQSGMSLTELARAANTSVSTLSKYENGRKSPEYRTLYRILRATGASLRLVMPESPNLKVNVSTPGVRSTPTESVLRPTGQYIEKIKSGLDDSDSVAFRALVQFADDFRRTNNMGRHLAVINQPDTTGDRRFDAAVAALVEYLCRENGVSVPAWVNDEELISKPVWYVSGEDSWTYIETPIEFRKHGVMIHKGAFASV